MVLETASRVANWRTQRSLIRVLHIRLNVGESVCILCLFLIRPLGFTSSYTFEHNAR